MKEDALLLAAKFSFMPNQLKYCGPSDTNHVLYNYVIGKEDRKKAELFLSRFEALMPYLELIAKANGKDKFDYDVIEAYWIGNRLLENVNSEQIKDMILKQFTKRGLPQETAEELASTVPANALPHHSFHVLHVHTITGKISPTLRNADKCRIAVGEVKKVMKDRLLVSYAPFVLRQKVELGETEEKEIAYQKGFIPDIKAGDKVAVHWDFAAHLLDEKEADALEKYTKQNIEAIGSLK